MAALNLLLTLVLTSAVHVWSYPDGPPLSACGSMSPQEGHSYSIASGGDVPFEISCQGSTYSSGQTITVTVERKADDVTHEMEGLFVQARLQGVGKHTKPVGLFFDAPEGTAAINCGVPGDAWAHTTELDATSARVSWRAPPCDIGPIAFMATIVGDPKEQYWTGLLSDQITFTGANSSDCSMQPPPDGGPKPGDGDKGQPGGNNGASAIGVPSMAAILGSIIALLGRLYF